jgi:diguanylate cyclase (GGDEF)-like protein
MLRGIKYVVAALVAVALFAWARQDLASIRRMATDSTFFTAQIAELTRLEKEMLAFRVQAAAVTHGEEAITRDDLLLSFDILWSRVNTEGKRFINPRIDAIRNYQGTLDALAIALEEIDPVVQRLSAGAEHDLEIIESAMVKFAPAVSEMNNDAYAELYARAVDVALMQRQALKSVDHFQWLFLVVSFAVILLLVRQLRHGEKLYAELQLREQEIRALASTDPLTGLNNRRHFDERMRAIDSGTWTGNLHMLLIDLDGFKQINDNEGHEAGDQMLRALARRLPAAAGPGSLIARLGGDEFAVVVRGSMSEARRAAEAVIAEISKPLINSGKALQVGASIGIATLNAKAPASNKLLRQADVALYQAKAQGRGCAWHFEDLKDAPRSETVQSAA